MCSKPENRLISSFCLPMETTASIKKVDRILLASLLLYISFLQTFLNTIHSVEGSFATCRNYSPDIKFRALICQGFKLVLTSWFGFMYYVAAVYGICLTGSGSWLLIPLLLMNCIVPLLSWQPQVTSHTCCHNLS